MFTTKNTAAVARGDEEREFPPRVTFYHPKTGLVVKQDPHVIRVIGQGGNRVSYMEYPAGSGNLFSCNKEMTPVGRWDAKKPEGERFLEGAPHVEWERPVTEDDKLAREVALTKAKNAELEAELAAIKAEREKKTSAVKKPQES